MHLLYFSCLLPICYKSFSYPGTLKMGGLFDKIPGGTAAIWGKEGLEPEMTFPSRAGSSCDEGLAPGAHGAGWPSGP